jgi:hypothetical protein
MQLPIFWLLIPLLPIRVSNDILSLLLLLLLLLFKSYFHGYEG